MTTFWSALVNGALVATVLTAVVWLALRVASRHAVNAATRYAIWWVVLLATLAVPLACMQWKSAEPPASRFSESPALDFGPIRTSLVPLAATPVSYTMSLPVQIRTSQGLQPLLVVWISCSLLLLARLVLSYAVLHRRSSRASDAPPEWSARVQRWTTRKHVRLGLSDEIGIPMATGQYRPTILIPRKLAKQINDDDLEQIGLHEATHLARRDDWMLCLQRIIEAFFALHPLVRWITRQIDLEREIACDDVVAGSTQSARRCADCLTRMVTLCGGVRAPLAAAGVTESQLHLSRRVAVLLDGSRVIRPRMYRVRAAVIAVSVVCITGMLVKTPRLIAFENPTVISTAPATVQPLPTVTRPQVLKPAAPRRPLLVAQLAPTPAPPPRTIPETPRYMLGANDVVAVAMTGQNSVSGTYAIGPDGIMSMPSLETWPPPASPFRICANGSHKSLSRIFPTPKSMFNCFAITARSTS